ncbi:MFS transporter [Saccharopolyspora sp. 6M]|uniref:MFS transporter n=1 Tax=Saccharopolyspora sp. 6M TaxID=2877237 RepID=UPI001CD61AA4|nr:MFS transporter [Saccharopolyspora sp. 6M]MCA1227453.1 MFS transporter [Saccharopolyspora sp. 6M]
MLRSAFRSESLTQLAPLRSLLLAVLVFRTGCVLLPFFGLYLTEGAHVSAGLVTLIVGCFGLGGLLADVSMPATLSRLSPGRAIPLALGVQAVALLVAAVAAQPTALVCATVVWGFCYEMVNPACYTLITRSVDAEHRKVAFAALRLCINVGMGLGPAIGSVLYAWGQFSLLFLVNAAFGLIAAVLVGKWAVGYEVPGERERTGGNAWHGSVRDEARFWTFMLTAFPAQLAFALPSTVLSLYIVSRLGLSPLVAGVILFLNAAMVVVIELPLNIATAQWSNTRAIVVGLLFAAAGFGMIGLHPSLWLLVLSTIVWTIGEMVIGPAFLGYVQEISSPRLLVRNMGAFSGGVNGGLLLAPVAYGIVTGSGLPGGIWSLVGVVLLVSVLVFGVISRGGRGMGSVSQRPTTE